MARSFRATSRQIATRVEIPAALPSILGGMRVGATLAVIGAIVAEWAGGESRPRRPDQHRPRQPVRHPAHVRHPRDPRPDRGRPVSRHGPRRAPPGRRPMRRRPSPALEVQPPVHPSRPAVRASRRRRVARARRRRLQRRTGATPSPVGPVAGRIAVRALDAPSAAPTSLTVGLGYIPSVQFAQFYLADQAGYYRDAGLDGDAPEQDRPRPRHAPRPGRRRHRQRRRHLGHPGRQPGDPDRLRRDDLRPVPVDRRSPRPTRASRPPRTSRARRSASPGKYGSSWIMLQALLGSAT